MEQMSPVSPVPSQGPVVGIIIIIIVLVIGAYFFFARFGMMQAPVPEPSATTSDMTVGASDDPDAIARDLEAQDLDVIDAELNALDAELNQ